MKDLFVFIGEFLLAHKLLALTFGLVCLIISNTLLGIVIAELKVEFDKEIMIRGLLKHSAIALAVFLIYVTGLVVPNMQVVLGDGEPLTFIEALDTGFMSTLAVYAAKVIKNLYILLTIDAKNKVEEINVYESLPENTEFVDGEG